MELHESLYALGQAFGNQVFEDPDSFRGALDDFLDEGSASTGDINLLADAVRLGAYRRMREMLASGATPVAAVDAAGELLARERGSADVAGSRWACAVLGYATGRMNGTEVQQYRTTPAAVVDGEATRPGAATPGDEWLGPSTERTPSPLRDRSTQPGTAPTPAPPTAAHTVAPAASAAAPTSGQPTAAEQRPSSAVPDYTQPTPRPARHRRSPWPLLVVAVVVLALIGALAWLTFGEDVRQAFDSTKGTSSTSGSTKGQGSKAHADRVTCWDGNQVTKTSLCTVPRGEAGLRWVFPSFDRAYENCYLRPIGGDPAKHSLRSWFCPVKPGSLAGHSYTEWRRTKNAVEKYANEYLTPHSNFAVANHPVGWRWRRTTPESDGRYKVTFVYHRSASAGGPPTWPFSTSVYAYSQKALDNICGQLVLRAPSNFTKAGAPCS